MVNPITMSSTTILPLILASSSPYRRELLQKLTLPFSCHSPGIDESAIDGEAPEELVKRLALEKALAVATDYPEALIIASDQVAVLENEIMTKPHTHENAIRQLSRSSGNTVKFLTSLCLLNSKTGQHQITLSPYSVEFLPLKQEQISAYLHKEQPYQCAGSFKSEGLGITLFKRFEGDDPNSLIGLPLIALTGMLRKEGVEPLTAKQ
jgi:septum formation protein